MTASRIHPALRSAPVPAYPVLIASPCAFHSARTAPCTSDASASVLVRFGKIPIADS